MSKKDSGRREENQIPLRRDGCDSDWSGPSDVCSAEDAAPQASLSEAMRQALHQSFQSRRVAATIALLA
jgi:hypothetical protein